MATKTVTSSVAFQSPQGTALALGVLILDLSEDAMITSGGGIVAPSRIAIVLDANGLIPSLTTLWANDQLTPSGTGYYAKLYNSNMALVADLGAWVISGTSPIDLSQEVSTALNVSYPNPVVTNPSATQVITGFGITLNGSTVVTETATETLTNKTLKGASNGNSVSLLNFQGVLSAVVGDSTDKTYYTYSLPANTLGAGKGLRIIASNAHGTGTAAITFKLSFGGTVTTGIGAQAAASARGTFEYFVFNNDGVTNAQTILARSVDSNGSLSNTIVDTSAVDTTGIVTILLKFNVANTDQITPRILVVELIQ